MLSEPVRLSVTLAFSLGLAFQSPLVRAQTVTEGKLIVDQIGTISSPLTGERSVRVEDVPVRMGDRLMKGDQMALLSTLQLMADRLVAQRAFEEAEALASVAKSNVAAAQLTYRRQAGLKGSPSFRRAAYEDAEVALSAAKSQLRSAESSAKRQQAEVGRIDLEIKLARIVAPYDGLVLEVLKNVGSTVTQKDPHLFRFLDLSRVEIEIQGSEKEIKPFQPGAEIFYSIANGEKLPGLVRAVFPNLGQSPPSWMARIKLGSSRLPTLFHDQQPVTVYLANQSLKTIE